MTKNLLLLSLLLLGFNVLTQTPGSGVTDIDGNQYTTVIIGSQEWMAENLRTTSYANGDAIPNVTDEAQWQSLTTGAWANYDNDILYVNPYGKLYNWYTIADSRNICPSGWHIPTYDEWNVLIDYLGGNSVAGGKMKSTGSQFWTNPNTSATNESGFSALPGGYRTIFGAFYAVSEYSYWWSSTDYGLNLAKLWYIGYLEGDIYFNGLTKTNGFSLRCLKDNPLGIFEMSHPNKELIKITNLLGQETEFKPNTVLFYVYSDGTTERIFKTE
jgi:uncharacterized protein (TIGR02145 family)